MDISLKMESCKKSGKIQIYPVLAHMKRWYIVYDEGQRGMVYKVKGQIIYVFYANILISGTGCLFKISEFSEAEEILIN